VTAAAAANHWGRPPAGSAPPPAGAADGNWQQTRSPATSPPATTPPASPWMPSNDSNYASTATPAQLRSLPPTATS